ncbi:flippase-like domain-containing protein [bacterium]|nr:flippase-like domain-containing protein [bacterium]
MIKAGGGQEDKKRKWTWLGRIAAGIGLIVCFWPFVNGGDLVRSLQSLSPEAFCLSLFLFLLGAVPAAVVWKYTLHLMKVRISLWNSWRLSLIGFFWNNIVPGGVAGDLARVWALHNNKVDFPKGAASVFTERWSAFFALFFASLAAWFMAAPIFENLKLPEAVGKFFPGLDLPDLKWGMLSVIGAMAAVLLLGSVLMWSSGVWQGLREKFLHKFSLGTSVSEFGQELLAGRKHAFLFTLFCFINILAPVFEALAVYVIFEDVCGVSLPFEYFLVFIPIFRIMLHLPISVNGIGTQEAAFALYWSILGLPLEPVLAVSILIHIVKFAMCLVGAILYFWPVKHSVCAPEDD